MTVRRNITRSRSTAPAAKEHSMRRTTKRTFIAVAVAVVIPFGAEPALAAPPNATIVSILPFENHALQAQRIAPYGKGGAERWRVRAHFFVKNNETETIRLTQTMIGYPNGPDEASADVKDTNDDPMVDSRDVAPGKTGLFIVEDGMARPGGKGGDRSLFFPMPDQVQVKLKFSGFFERVIHTTRLRPYVNKTPQGSYLFPAKHTDLDGGQRWSGGIHAFSRSQKFAYDLGVSRWDLAAKKWTGLVGTDDSDVEDYLVWGKRVHAMASGTVVRSTWSHPDNKNVGVDDHGVNSVVIDHGNGEFSLYAHLQQGSLNPQLRGPTEGTYGVNIPVAAGQFLGLAGNSGSSKPHLHVQLTHGANGKQFEGNAASGLPLHFRDARNVSTIDKATIGPGPFAYNTMTRQAPAAPFNLINLSPLPLGNP